MTPAPAYPRRAHLYWVRAPHEPRGKRRPALVVSPDSRNRLANDVIVVPVSSVLRKAPTHVGLRADEGGLARPPVAKCEQITTLRHDRLLPHTIACTHDPNREGDLTRHRCASNVRPAGRWPPQQKPLKPGQNDG